MTDLKVLVCAGCALVNLALGLFGGYMIRDSLEAPEVVTPAPEERQDDGSLILERRPDPSPSPPPHEIPKGAVEERHVSVVVRPVKVRKPAEAKNDEVVPAPEPCPDVRIDLSLIRDTQGGRRVIASSPDGRIHGGLDVPIVGANVTTQRKWAAGISYDPFRESPGAWVERDYGRLRFGADLHQDRTGYQTGMAARVRIGWTF